MSPLSLELFYNIYKKYCLIFTQRSATPYKFYMDKVSVYYLDPLNFRRFYSLISALLRGLQIVAASKPISLSTILKTILISLNNNFGTLTLVLGCFPFDIQPYHSMSDNLRFIFVISSLQTHR